MDKLTPSKRLPLKITSIPSLRFGVFEAKMRQLYRCSASLISGSESLFYGRQIRLTFYIKNVILDVMKKAAYSYLFLATFSLGMGGILVPAAFASVTVIPATGGINISADKAANAVNPAYTALVDIQISEGAGTNGDFSVGTNKTLILTAPSGWQFNPTVGSVSFMAGRNISAASLSVTSPIITATLTVGNTNKADTLIISGIQVRAVAGESLSSSGNILRTSANPGTQTINGIVNDSTNFGSLSQVAGAVSASKSTMSASPVSASTDGGAQTTVTVSAYDQFNNPKASQTVVLSSTGTGNAFTQPSSLTATTTGALSSTKAETKTISATIAGTLITQTASATFIPGTLDRVTITPGGTQSVAGGSAIPFLAQGFDINNNAITGLAYIWTAVPGTGTGSVTSGGVLTGGIAGTLTVTATSGTKTGTSGTVTVSNVAPIVNNQSVSTNEDTSLPITLSGTDANGDTVTYSIISNPTHGTLSEFNTSTGAVTYNPTANYNGTDFFTFRSDDGIANSNTGTISLTVNAVNDAPVLTAIGNKSTNENQLLSFTITATDVDGDPLSYSAANLPVGAAFATSTRIFSWTPTFDQSGIYKNVRFSATDGTLSASEDITITVSNVNRTPALTAIGNKTANENSLLQFTVSGTDPDGDALTYSATNLPAGATLDTNTGTFSWTPTYSQSGTYNNVHFSVTDGILSASEDITLTVNNVNRAPALNAIGNKSIDENQILNFAITGSDLDGDALTYSASNLPTGATFDSNSGTLSWKPNFDQSGEYAAVHFEVSDSQIAAGENILITVNNVSQDSGGVAIGSTGGSGNLSLFNFGASPILAAPIISTEAKIAFTPATQPPKQQKLTASNTVNAIGQNSGAVTVKTADQIAAPSLEQTPSENPSNKAPKEKTSLLANLADLISIRGAVSMIKSAAQTASRSFEYLKNFFLSFFLSR